MVDVLVDWLAYSNMQLFLCSKMPLVLIGFIRTHAVVVIDVADSSGCYDSYASTIRRPCNVLPLLLSDKCVAFFHDIINSSRCDSCCADLFCQFSVVWCQDCRLQIARMLHVILHRQKTNKQHLISHSLRYMFFVSISKFSLVCHSIFNGLYIKFLESYKDYITKLCRHLNLSQYIIRNYFR